MTLKAVLPVAAATLCMALCACGEGAAGGAATAGLTPTADRAEAQANSVAVSPLPGTEDASPDTQISFLGEADTTVSNVSVVGSRSGNHPGKLKRYSTGHGRELCAQHAVSGRASRWPCTRSWARGAGDAGKAGDDRSSRSPIRRP